MQKHVCFLRISNQWWPSVVFESIDALLDAFAKVASNDNLIETLRADALDDLVRRSQASLPVDGKVALALGHQQSRLLWGDDAAAEARDFLVLVCPMLKIYKADQGWMNALSEANKLIHLVPGQAPSSFAERHLVFLNANNTWQPALIFDSFAHLQEALQKVLSTVQGFEKAQLAAVDSLMGRMKDHSKFTNDKIAMTLGADKLFLWNEDMKETREYSSNLRLLLQENHANKDWMSALTVARKLFRVKPISFDIVNSFQAEVQPAQPMTPVAPTLLPTTQPESKQDTPAVLASVDGAINGEVRDDSTDKSKSDMDNETVEPARPPPAKRKTELKKAPAKKSAKKVGKTVAKKAQQKEEAVKSVPRTRRRSPATAKAGKKAQVVDQAQQKSKEAKVKSVLKARRRSVGRPKAGKKEQIDPELQSDDDEMYQIPSFPDVQGILNKLGYKTEGSKYYFRPGMDPKKRKDLKEGTHYFTSIAGLRRFLCMRGVEMKGFEKDKEKNKEQLGILQQWIRYSISPGLRNVKTVPEDARQPLDSIHHPLMKLGFKCKDVYFLPGVKPKKFGGIFTNGFKLDGEDGMWAKLCRYGLPGTCNFKNLSETDRLRLELYLADCLFVDTFDFLKREADANFLESMKKPPSSERVSDVVATKPPGAAPITPTHAIGPSSAFMTSSSSPDEGSTTGESVGATVVTNSTGASTDYDNDNDTANHMDESDPLASDKEVVSHVSNQVESAEKFAASAVRQVTRAFECSNDLTPQSAKELFKTTPPGLAEKRRQGPSSPPSAEDADEKQGGVQTGSSSAADGASTDEPLRSDKAPSQQFGSRTEAPAVEHDSTNNSIAASVTKQTDLSSSQAKSHKERKNEAQDALQTDRGRSDTLDKASSTGEPPRLTNDPSQQSESVSPKKKIVSTTVEKASPTLSEMSIEIKDSAGVTGSPDVGALCDPEGSDVAPFLTQDAAISGSHCTSDEDPTEGSTSADIPLESTSAKTIGEQVAEDVDLKNDANRPDDGASASSSTQNSAFASPPTQDTADEPVLETDSIPEGRALMASGPSQLTGDAAREAFVATLAGGYVKPDDLWAEVSNKMKACKLTWVPGTGLTDFEYVFPGMSSSKKGGILGYDYVESMFDLQQLAFDRCGWKGDTAFFAEKARLMQTTCSSRGRSSPRQRSTVDVKPLAVEKSKPKRISRKQSAVQELGKKDVLDLNVPKRSSPEHAIAPAAKRQKETSGKAKREPESQVNRLQKRSCHTSPKNKSVQVSTKRQRRNAPPKKPGKVKEELRCCQRDLQQNKKSKTLAIIDIIGKPSKFKHQVCQVQSFLRNVIKNRKASDNDTEKPILYVCGAPGVGKTSAVEWCCQQATGIQSAFVNVASTSDPKVVLQEIKEALDIPGQQLTVTSFKKHLKKNTEGVVVLVIDEIDHMLSARSNDGKKMTAKEKLLNEFCTVASDPENAFALIGIANSVGASAVKKLKSLGMGDKTVPFAPYTKDDLVELIIARVGRTSIEEKALQLLATKVSSASGDARMMLELVSSAVDHCKRSLSDAELEAVLEQPIVALRHAIQATKKAIPGKVAERIENLPGIQKQVLCLAVTACKALPAANLTPAHLRQYINEILRNDGLETVNTDVFNATIQNLVDQGLLMPADAGDKKTRANRIGSFREKNHRFGHQLEDVESIIGKKLAEKPVYGRLMDAIRARPPTQE